MLKTWSNGYTSILINVKPLVSVEQEEGFISPELFGMLDEAERSALKASYDSYVKNVASCTKAQNDQFNSGSTISTHDINRNLSNCTVAKECVKGMVTELKSKYGIKTPTA